MKAVKRMLFREIVDYLVILLLLVIIQRTVQILSLPGVVLLIVLRYGMNKFFLHTFPNLFVYNRQVSKWEERIELAGISVPTGIYIGLGGLETTSIVVVLAVSIFLAKMISIVFDIKAVHSNA